MGLRFGWDPGVGGMGGYMGCRGGSRGTGEGA